MYAIRDGTLANFRTPGLPIAPRTLCARQSATASVGIGAVAPDGWYHDLPNAAIRAHRNDPAADLNLVAYVGTIVQPDPCLTRCRPSIYARDYTTAESLIFTRQQSVVQPYFSTEGAVGLELVGMDQADGSLVPGTAIVFTREIDATIKPVEAEADKSFGGGQPPVVAHPRRMTREAAAAAD